MRNLFVATACAWLLTSVPAVAAESSVEAEGLGKLIAGNAHTLSVEDGGIDGPGAEWLVKRADQSRFVLLGESHMTAEIPRIARGIWQAVHPLGYEYAAIETSPWAASLIEDKLRSDRNNAYSDYVTDGNHWTIPFYTTLEDSDFLRSVIKTSGAKGPALWGLDQVFNAGGVRVLKRLLMLAATDQQRKAVEKALEAARRNPEFVGTAGEDELRGLESAFEGARGEAARLVSQLLLSHEIYGPFSRDDGNVYRANRQRESLMKRNFMDYYLEAGKRVGMPPRVFLKFGAFHMFRGHTPTHVLGLGNFVTEVAIADGAESIAVLVVCAGGRARAFRTGEAEPCQGLRLPEAFKRLYPDDGYALFDLEALRPHHDLWASFPRILRKVIWSYDAMIVVPEASPATMPGGAAAGPGTA